MKMFLAAVLTVGLAVAGARAADDHKHDHKHEHKAPHDGTLVVFGDEFAHIELVLDAKEGKLTAYVLDGHAEKGVRVDQKDVTLEITSADGKTKKVALTAVANKLTGEKEGDTSVFSATDEIFKDAKTFKVKLEKLKVKGKTFLDIKFSFPEGNE
jgi:hypothetical protein